MGLHYKNLDSKTREYMLLEDEIGGHYKSPRIEDGKMQEWLALFRQALGGHSDDWLAAETNRNCLIKENETKKKPNGGFTTARVPHNAAQQLAEGEFNRFYLRGIAARAIAEGKTHLKVYRGRESANPRPESEAKIDTLIDAKALLEALRTESFVDSALGLPAGPNSGLTAEIAQ